MLLKHARESVDGQPIENTFEAIDERTGSILACCTIYTHESPALFPSRPLRIFINIEGSPAPELLLGAAVARAKELAHQSKMPSRIFAELDPDDDELMEQLELLGFTDNDGLIYLERELEEETEYRLPAGCVIVLDDLDDPIEQKYFLDRYNPVFNEEFDFAWLQNYRKKPGFKRILIVSPNGMVGECIVWNKDGAGIIDWIFVANKWRSMNISGVLADLACAEFSKAGYEVGSAEVQARMPRMMHVMESAGFRQKKLLCRYPGIDIDPE